MAAQGVLRSYEGGRIGFWCPACKRVHIVPVSGTVGPQWGFNDNWERPTITPSIQERGKEPLTEDEYNRVMAGEKIELRDYNCHTQVTDGRIFYYEDSSHGQGGTTVDMEEFDPEDAWRPADHKSPEQRAADRGMDYVPRKSDEEEQRDRDIAAGRIDPDDPSTNSNSNSDKTAGSVLEKPDPKTRIT